ncbi:uncharacterized protein LOC127547109 [Antechinus flavipes]|uniref:uncharacterized protein LOC127547109 n=1 Tax=Antechinus flavipes TaxID=38775 RepID=UPI0022362F98|nr:uncharacterized protein LOC127547109 [Antechinus flavipes]
MGNLACRKEVSSQALDFWEHKKEEEEGEEKIDKIKEKGCFVFRFKRNKDIINSILWPHHMPSGCPCYGQSNYMMPEESDSQVSNMRWVEFSPWAQDLPSCCLSPQETQAQAEREQKYKCLHLMEELAGLMQAGEMLHNEMNGCQGSVSLTTKSLLAFWQRLSSQLDEDHPIHHTPHYYHRRLHSLLWVYGNGHDRSSWRRRE